MKIAFVQQFPYESMGIMSISAVLRSEGHATRLFVDGFEPDLPSAVAAWRPDLIGFHTITGQHKWALDLAGRLRRRVRASIVLGGPHATFVPEVVDDPRVDVVVRGEGEEVLSALCRAGGVAGVTDAIRGALVKRASGDVIDGGLAPILRDLDALPLADRDLPYRYRGLRRRGIKAFVFRRGCAFPCTFCCNHVLMRLYRDQHWGVRRVSPERAIEEILHVRDHHGPLDVVNLENNDDLLDSGAWSEAFFPAYRARVGLPYFLMARADRISADSARLLAETGCIGVALSLETATDKLRNEVLKKRFTSYDYLSAMEHLNRFGIRTKVFSVVGLPGESLDDAFDTLAMNVRSRPTFASCSVLQPYPGTDILEQCRQVGALPPGMTWDAFDTFYYMHSLLRLPDIAPRENLQKFFALAVRFPALTPIVKQMVRLPPNPLFDTVGMAAYAVFALAYEERSLGSALRLLGGSLNAELKQRLRAWRPRPPDGRAT